MLVDPQSGNVETDLAGLATGGGIGVLPTYAYWIGSPLVPLDLDVHETVDIWLTYHPDAKSIPRVSRLIDWVIQSFSPEKYPWFRDEFIHPEKLLHLYPGELLPTSGLMTGRAGARG